MYGVIQDKGAVRACTSATTIERNLFVISDTSSLISAKGSSGSYYTEKEKVFVRRSEFCANIH